MDIKYPPHEEPVLSMYGPRGGGWGGLWISDVKVVKTPVGNKRVQFTQAGHGTADLYLTIEQARELAKALTEG